VAKSWQLKQGQCPFWGKGLLSFVGAIPLCLRSGCGNTVNANHPATQQQILESLRWWVEEYHVDGFRFDLGEWFLRRLWRRYVGGGGNGWRGRMWTDSASTWVSGGG